MRCYCLQLVSILLLNVMVLDWATAAVYKCKDAGGNITYSQTACPLDEDVAKVMNISTGSDVNSGVECSIVRNFAAEIGIEQQKGRSIDDVAMTYDSFVNPISQIALQIIRSVFEYQSQPYKTIEDSIAHEDRVCKSEVYGSPVCSDFPVKFIKVYGGCRSAGNLSKRLQRLRAKSMKPNLVADNRKMNNRLEVVARQAKARDLARREKQSCLADYDSKLKINAQKSRQSQTHNKQDKLRTERRSLRSARGKC